MSLAVVASRALAGFRVLPVRVEAHLAAGLPAFHVVGLPDAGVRESRDRVRAAILSSGYDFPAGRLTINLAPADLPKASGRYDLPIALAVLLASGQVAAPPAGAEGVPPLSRQVFVGELSLTGAVVAVSDALVIALAAAREAPPPQLVLPQAVAGDAARVPGLDVRGAATLADVVAHCEGRAAIAPAAAAPAHALEADAVPCLSDVRGQPQACRALEVAAAGGHSLLLSGPPGTGKSMLARRLAGLLPPLDDVASLEVAALSGLAGAVPRLSRRVPFRAPHHSASVAALIGGGAHPRPGDISRAHHGILFLDELPEFDRRALEALREPLEDGHISIARASASAVFPADFQLVAAMNPCPCGWLGQAQRLCRCTPDALRRYRGRLSGPLLDRIDLRLTVAVPPAGWMAAAPAEASAEVRPRVAAARLRQRRRQGVLNARLPPDAIETHCRLPSEARHLLSQAAARWHWSGRAVHRVLRVSRTLADLRAGEHIEAADVAEAIQHHGDSG